jgi:hypothetical protein
MEYGILHWLNYNLTQSAPALDALNTFHQRDHHLTQWTTSSQILELIKTLKILTTDLKKPKKSQKQNGSGRHNLQLLNHTQFQISELMRKSLELKMVLNGLKVISISNGNQPKMPTDSGTSQRPLLLLHTLTMEKVVSLTIMLVPFIEPTE